MKDLEKNADIWDGLYAQGASWLEIPCEDLVAYFCVGTKGDEVEGKKVLDLGFGPGNNMKFLLSRGLECHGLEVSEVAKNRLEEVMAGNDKVSLSLYDGGGLPYEDAFFDYIVAWHSITYSTAETIGHTIDELYRISKPGAKVFISMITPRDIAPQTGEDLGDHTYLMTEVTGQAGAKVYVFEDEEHIKSSFHRFNVLDIGYNDFKKFGRINSHWLIALEKEA